MHKDNSGLETGPGDLSNEIPPSDFQPLLPSGEGYHRPVSRSPSVPDSRGPSPSSRHSDPKPEERVYARRATDTEAYKDLEVVVRHLRRQVSLIMDSLPSRNVDEHMGHHEDYSQVLKERKEKEEDDLKLKKELKSKLIKTVAQAVFMAFLVILGLGLQAQFSKWVNQAVENQAAASMNRGAPSPVVGGDKK